MQESLETINEPAEKKYESDVDRMLDEVYGHGAVEMFDEMWREHPEWSLEEALRAYEKNPTGNQTYFFRTGNLATTAREIMPQIKKGEGEDVRILDIGSATGQEAYSLGIHLLENNRKDFRITGVDVTPKAVEEARAGEYRLWLHSADQVGSFHDSSKLTQDHLKKDYFHDTGKQWGRKQLSGKYSIGELMRIKKSGIPVPEDAYDSVPQVILGVGKELKDRVLFAEHDILESPVSGEHDIVLMNHVLIHYPAKSCDQIVNNALASLRPGGFLVLEHAMTPMNDEEKEWLEPYNKWREDLTKKFPLEEVATKAWYSDEPHKSGQYFRFLGRDSNSKHDN
jgi:chemotaxis methyl-accepting protein methylase